MARYSTKKPKPQPAINRLPLFLALAGLLLLMIAGIALWASNRTAKSTPQVTGAPHLSVDKDSIDHGQVKLGTPIRDDIRVTNTGDQPLKFSEAPYIEVKEGC